MPVPERSGIQEDQMRCAVSGNTDLLAESGRELWLDELQQAGIEFVVLPEKGSRQARLMDFQNCEAVLLADGSARGAALHGGRGLANRRTEREMVRIARARRLPVVGIGQGAEFLGLYFGGRLCASPDQRPGDRRLDLRVAPGFGPTPAKVHLAGRMLCDPKDFPAVLSPIAWDEHGRIAGFVHRDEPILGIHWLPASPVDGAADLVVDALRGHSRHDGGVTRVNA
jgi:anthranilate/para-aminobenzoate synthase component II